MKILWYGYEKLIGAGFSFSIYGLIMLLSSSFDLFEVSESLSSPMLWAAFYGYGIYCSIIIDGICNVWPMLHPWKISLYIASGFVIFIFLMANFAYILIAGTIGTAAALLFYAGMSYFRKRKWISSLFALVLPLIFLAVSIMDFTEKEGWEVQRQTSSYEVSFTYFNGEHKIPVKLKENQTLMFQADFSVESGGYGHHAEDQDGDRVPMHEIGDKLALRDVAAGQYYIVIHGDNAKGRVDIDWEIRTKSE
ncbi:hypothetical protein SAMN04488072_106155 [Lentibacillus halodurans]|uniref:Uncharacterized protein n=1 Tax=Lentibacillus halodurans TaxID=237679 RepID=A0A1I0XZG7_9BACI|nr:hypothetical protein [Lentibacillus halodurans]SFB06509.1 hypothetical protein SAMN04488072_106155 [Lentibacillus halodurans]